MGLYIGGSKIKVKSGNITYRSKLYVSSTAPIVNGITLLSSDGYTLKDSKGVYLTTKESN